MPYVIRGKSSGLYLNDAGNWFPELNRAYMYATLQRAAEEALYESEDIVEVDCTIVMKRIVPTREALEALD